MFKTHKNIGVDIFCNEVADVRNSSLLIQSLLSRDGVIDCQQARIDTPDLYGREIARLNILGEKEWRVSRDIVRITKS